jgi:hypothetical protein
MTFVAVDHLVVGAASLAEGVAWCEATLGVTPGPGGKHPLMGTHNRLLKIASAVFENAYLEIIAIDPDAPPPGRRRWFGLDEADLSGGPRLLHWVGRSPMLDMHRWGLITVGCQPGDPVDASRETPAGTLAWQILVRADGRLECGGALPTLIQWRGLHPTEAMPDSGVTLQSLALRGVGERARKVLRLRGVGVAKGSGPALTAVLQTPLGALTLETR